MRRGKQVDAEEAAAAAAEQQQRLLSSLREMLQRELRQSTARPAAAAAEPQSASEAAQTDSLSRALLSAVPALLDPLLRRSRLLMEHESPYRHNLSTTDLLAASSLPPHWNPLRQPALFALPPGSPAEQPLTLRALLGVSCPLSLLLLPSVRLPHLLPRLQRLLSSYPFTAPRQILSALKCDEGERWRLERALSEIQRLLRENPLPQRQLQASKPWKQRREEALALAAELRPRAPQSDEAKGDGEAADEEMEDAEGRDYRRMSDVGGVVHQPQSSVPQPQSSELASLEDCPSLLPAKQADDALRRQFAAGDPTELRRLPPMLGLTALHGEDTSADEWGQLVQPLSEPRLALLLQSPLPASAPAFCAHRARFATRWTALTNGLFEGLDWSNLFCAGGAVLACLAAEATSAGVGASRDAVLEKLEESGYGQSDVDLFIVGLDAEAATTKLRATVDFLRRRMADVEAAAAASENVSSDSASERLLLSSHSVTLLGGPLWPTVQVVLRCYSSPAEVLLGFDVDCCCVGFDGQRAWANSRGLRALSHRVNVVDLTRRSTTYEQRLIKYAGRGFAVGVANLSLDDVDWPFMDEMTKSGALRHAQGLTRLLMEHRRYALSRGSPLERQKFHARSRRSKAKLLASIGGSEMVQHAAQREKQADRHREAMRKRDKDQRRQRAAQKAAARANAGSAAAASSSSAPGSANAAVDDEAEPSESDVSDSEWDACDTLDPQRKRQKEFSQFLLWRDYGWTPAWGHFSPAVLQGLWSAAEDPAAPWLEFRMRDGRSVFLCKFAAFLSSGTASDAPLPCGLQWLTRNPGQQDAPILESGNGAAAAAATAGSASAALASASSSPAAAAAPLFTGSFQPLPASVSDWASVSQWHRAHVSSADSFGALLYAISLRRRAFMTQRLCAELREKASAHMRPYVDEQAAAVIVEYLGPARLPTEEQEGESAGAPQKDGGVVATPGVASIEPTAFAATAEFQTTLSSLHGSTATVALPRAAFPDEVVQRLWQREHKGAAPLPKETVDLLYHLALHVIDRLLQCVLLCRQRAVSFGGAGARALDYTDVRAVVRIVLPFLERQLSLRYYYYSHLNSLHYFRADHLHAALRALVGPRAQTFKVTTSGAEMVGEMVDVVLRMTLREAGRILHRKSGMAEPTKRAPLFNRTPAPPRAQVKLNTNEPAPPSKPRPLSALAQRQDVLLQTRHVLAALGSDVDLRPLFDGLLVPALRSEDAPAGAAASASSPFLPLLRVALERSASAAVGASARVADALSESVLQRTVAALSPVLGALLPQFFRATRRGLWQLQQAGAATEPAHKDGGATTSAAVAPLGSATVLLLPRVCPLFPSGAGPVAAASLCLVSPRVHVRDSVAPSFALAELEAALGELSLNADGAGALPQSEQARLAEATQQQLAATRKGAVYGPPGSSLAQSDFVSVEDPSEEEVTATVRPLLPRDWFRAQAVGTTGSQSDSAPLPALSSAGWLVYQLQCEAVLLRALRSAGGQTLPLSSPVALGRLRRELSLLLPEDQRAALPKPDADLLLEETGTVSAAPVQPAAATGASASAASAAAVAASAGSGAVTAASNIDASGNFAGLPWCARKFSWLYRAQVAEADEKWRAAHPANTFFSASLPPYAAALFDGGAVLQSVDALAPTFAPAEFVRRQQIKREGRWGPQTLTRGTFVSTQVDAMLLEQCASQARATGLFDEAHGLQLDVAALRGVALRMCVEQRRQVGFTAAGLVLLQILLETELARLLRTAVQLQRERRQQWGASMEASAAAAPASVSCDLPSLCDLREAWLLHHGGPAPF